MSKVDTSLVYLLTENARMSLKELAVHLRKSPQRLKYTISSLQKEEILYNPFSVIDYSYFGLLLFRVYFKGAYVSEGEKTKIIEELKNNPFVVSVYELTGEYDLIAEFASPNPSKFNKELKKLTRQIPTLDNYKILLNLVTHISPKHYLTKNDKLQNIHTDRIVGGDRPREEFNSKELEIMKQLVIKPTVRLTELSKKSGLNVKTAKSVVISLMKRNILKGFRYSINFEKLGIAKARLFLRLHNLSPEREAQLMEYLLKTENVVIVHKTVGDWDMEIDVESFDKNKMRYILTKLREDFKDLIERSTVMEFYSFYKHSYLPMHVFDDQSLTLIGSIG
ncbi:AsnC family transcriptional regulator [Candidatus Woesearchaeota archaeon]|nr:AsnC family transcriptional regulator [Candidatus Woesearchaeota archaeon]